MGISVENRRTLKEAEGSSQVTLVVIATMAGLIKSLLHAK